MTPRSPNPELLRRSSEQRRLSRYDKFQAPLPRVLFPEPRRIELQVAQSETRTRTSVSNIRGVSARRQRNTRFNWEQRRKATNLTQ